MKTVLITGINGFLGSNLAKTFKSKYNIVGLENKLNDLNRIKNEDFKVYSSAENRFSKIFEEQEINIIIHTATIYRKDEDLVNRLLETNILLPVTLIEFAEKNGITAFINTDSFFNNDSNKYSYLSDYTLSKRHCLEWLKVLHNKVKLINMKLFHMYGPNDSSEKFVTKIIEELKANKPFIELTKGEQKRDFIYINDVVSAYNTVLNSIDNIEQDSIEFHVGTGNAVSLRDFVETASRMINSKSELRFGALNYRKDEIMFSQADTSNLQSFSWFPAYNVELGIRDYLENNL